MEFKTFHNDFFRAVTGAFSRVTDREYFDSQITLTGIETDIVINHFGTQNILNDKVASNPQKAKKQFLLYPSLQQIELNLVFPKSNKTELRLYISSTKGFKPKANEIWFIFKNTSNQLVIGSLPENIWNDLGQNDTIDDEYQTAIERTLTSKINLNISPDGQIQTTLRGSQTIYVRDPRLAIMRFTNVNYKCEIDDSHDTFISQKTKLQYMEAHHFIPMKYQPHFKTPLDNLNNIISLCPICHRGIHHAVIDYKMDLINKIYIKRPELHNYSVDYIAQFYNAIKVPMI